MVLALVLLLACAERTPDPDEPMIDLDQETGRRPAATASPQASGTPAPEEPRRRSATIQRAALEAVLDAGPGRFLASIEIKARLHKDRFAGWEVVKSPYAGVDLVTGDVVLGVNGRTLEHPLELKLLWEDLRKANAIAVDVDRKGEKFTLHFDVVPSTSTAPAP